MQVKWTQGHVVSLNARYVDLNYVRIEGHYTSDSLEVKVKFKTWYQNTSLKIIKTNRCQLTQRCFFLIQDQTLFTRQNDNSFQSQRFSGDYSIFFIPYGPYSMVYMLNGSVNNKNKHLIMWSDYQLMIIVLEQVSGSLENQLPIIKNFQTNFNFCVVDWNFYVFGREFHRSFRISQHFIKSLYQSTRCLVLVSFLTLVFWTRLF